MLAESVGAESDVLRLDVSSCRGRGARGTCCALRAAICTATSSVECAEAVRVRCELSRSGFSCEEALLLLAPACFSSSSTGSSSLSDCHIFGFFAR